MNTNSVMLSDSIKVDTAVSKAIYFKVKRGFDILFGFFGVLFMIPLAFIIKAVSIVNRDYHSIFYKQKRVGKDGRLFYIYKFRTMVPNAEQILNNWLINNEEIREEYYKNRKLVKDPRITKMGKFLRATSLDEFPQFLNVLKGEMSLIGPRPVVVDEINNYGRNKVKFTEVKPGLTGYWASNGRSKTTYEERMKMELFYVDNCSFLLDLKIIFRTIKCVLKREGAE